ncbi:hypothetical protein [Streptomyces sviceus]|uniref:hypothetical protein n=1 Tax=Streptomyces sviceus TaxID=285530 RepID=UPI0036912A9B
MISVHVEHLFVSYPSFGAFDRAAGRVEPVAPVQGFEAPTLYWPTAPDCHPTRSSPPPGTGRPDLRSLVGWARAHLEAARLYFAGYTDPLTGVLRQAGIEARAIGHALRRETARGAPSHPRVSDRTADTLRGGHAPS